MNKLLRLLKISVISFVILLISLIVIAWSMEEKITKLALEEMSDYLEVPFSTEKVNFTLLKEFPLATVKFTNVWLGMPVGDSEIDTIARFDHLYLSADAKLLWNNIFQVKEVESEGGFVKYQVDSLGMSNIDFLLSTDSLNADTLDQSSTFFELQKLTINGLAAYYADEAHQINVKGIINNLEGDLTLDSLQTLIDADADLQVQHFDVYAGDFYELDNSDLKFHAQWRTDTLLVDQLSLLTEGVKIATSGQMCFKDNTNIKAKLEASNLDLVRVTNHLPKRWLNDFQISDVAGVVQLNGEIEGNINDGQLPYYAAEVSLTNGAVMYSNYPKVQRIELVGSINNGTQHTNATTSINVKKLNFTTGQNYLSITGALHNLDRMVYDVKASVNADLKDWRSYVQYEGIQALTGGVKVNLISKGTLPECYDITFVDNLLNGSEMNLMLNDVQFEADSIVNLQHLHGSISYRNHQVNVDSLDITLPDYNLDLKETSIVVGWEGKLNQLDSLLLNVDIKNLYTDGIGYTGNAKIKNLKHPNFTISNSELDIDLTQAKRFIPDSLVNDVSGVVRAKFSVQGKLNYDSIANQLPPIIYNQSELDLVLDHVDLSMPDTLLNIQSLSGHVHAAQDTILFDQIRGKYAGIDFRVDTTSIENLIQTLVNDQPGKLKVKGVWRVSHLDYKMLAAYTALEGESSADLPDEKPQGSGKTKWDGDIDIKGKVFIAGVKYGKAEIEDISTLVSIKPNNFVIDELKFKAFEGELNSSLNIALDGDKIEIDMKNQIDHVNMRKLLADMDNFGQNEMTYKNISGILSTDSFFSRIVMNGDSLLLPELRMAGDFTLQKGGIFMYAPVQDLAPSIPGVKSLDTLVFKTISSNVFILKNAIYVPKTYVVSNAFDISAVGMQSFGDDYEYHLQVHLGEILLGKSKKRLKKQAKAGEEVGENDRRSVFVKSYSLDGKEKSGLDNKKDRSLMEVTVKTQNKLLDLIFHPHLVSFETGVPNEFRTD